jgi:tetratricopeptide (TPR) repeat protein
MNGVMEVSTLLARGNYSEARAVASEQLQRQPDSAIARYDWGLVELMGDHAAEACQWIAAAIEIDPRQARFHCNLGQAQLRVGDMATAIDSFRTAIGLQPDYHLARYNLACALLESGKLDEPEALFANLAAAFPEQPDYLCAQGDVARIEGHWGAAIEYYEAAIGTGADHSRAEGNLGALLVYFGRHEQALQHCQRAVALTPESYLSHLHLGRCYVLMEQFDDAMNAFADAYEINSESPQLCNEIAAVWRMSGDLQEAANWYARTQQLDAHNAPALAGIAATFLARGMTEKALALLQPAVDEGSASYDINRAYADALWDSGDAAGALLQIKKLQAIQPENAALYAKAGQIKASSGAMDEAREEYLRALAVNPRCIPALHGLAVKEKANLQADVYDRIRALLDDNKLATASRGALHNSLAYFYDASGAWEKAADHMQMANELQWQHHSIRDWDYDAGEHQERCARARKVYSSLLLQGKLPAGSDSLEPVFIVGMPRSGTTLTEQIIGRHPAALGIGEQNFAALSQASLPALLAARTDTPFDQTSDPLDCISHIDEQVMQTLTANYLQQLNSMKVKAGRPDALRVVDKMPDNYNLLGWITTLFPKAKIIHCKRDPRDVALSCWLTQFGKIQWASRIEDLVQRIAEYQKMMAFWRDHLPGHFIEVEYETTVRYQERESRRLIEWLRLDWDDACLSFFDSDRLVRTASINQVRMPIYQSSVARWENYQSHIPQLLDIELS